MSRLLAIDFGTKRSGIAVTDPMKIIASGLCTVPTDELMDYLKSYFKEEDVECVVIGLPKQMNNEASQSEVSIEAFIKLFQKEFPTMKVERQDERFTSKIAAQAIRDAGLKKQQRSMKGRVDQVSATLILQSYLDFQKNSIK